MKRLFFTAVLLCAWGGVHLFSIDLSAGGGFTLLPYEEGLNIVATGYKTGNIRNHWADWGAHVFFDAQYVELQAGYYRAFFGDYEQRNFGGPLDIKSEFDDVDISYIDLSLLAKYPLEFGGVTITPMIGLGYWINLDADYGYESLTDLSQDVRKTEWDQWWLKFGLGLDKYVTKELYLRFAVKLDFPLTTEEWKDRGGNIKDVFGIVIKVVDAKYSGVGGDFSLALGYKIN
ncbi:MAG: autotransporter domain-containing protein [Spirochaetaceae bacterium]|nr:autotransporter domain-containing protein [Spirochaetaceae bacterium]